jgi:acyl carrier protein
VSQLESAKPEERFDLLLGYVRSLGATIMRFDSPDQLEPTQGFFQLGMDSLMAMELKNRLQTGLGRRLPPTIVFDYPTATVLSRFLHDEMFPPSKESGAQKDEAAAEIESLSRDELKALLDEELDLIEGLAE